MTLLLAIAACLLTAFILIALAMVYGGPDPMREHEIEDLAAHLVRVKHQLYVEARANDSLVDEIERLTSVVDAMARDLTLKSDQIETLSLVINDRTGRDGVRFRGLGGH